MNECTVPKKKSPLLRVCYIISFIIIILLLISASTQIFEIMKWNDYFKNSYITEIQPKGEAEINTILYNVSNISDNQQKLNEIAKWELDGFESYHWGNKSYSHPL